jgi:hypothetical protein
VFSFEGMLVLNMYLLGIWHLCLKVARPMYAVKVLGSWLVSKLWHL